MKIGIVGLGLIGASLAKASSKAGHSVYGTDIDTQVVSQAIKEKIISSEMSIEELSNTCDIVVLCVPSRTATTLVERALRGSAIVSDVSSVKSVICDEVSKLDRDLSDRFIGGHPMAGSEQSGIDASRENMFESKMWILVPPEHNSLKHIEKLELFVSSIGAEHCILSPAQHDKLVANISHLPQLASSALMDIAADKASDNEIILRLAGGGFRDMTRIAFNNKQMWMDIIQDNGTEISKALSTYIENLSKIRDSIDSSDFNTVEDLFDRARSARGSLPDAARRLENLSEILIPVPDIPGVLSKITALSSDLNVYDIKIVHALEEDRGVLSLIVRPEDAELLITRLVDNGFQAKRSDIS